MSNPSSLRLLLALLIFGSGPVLAQSQFGGYGRLVAGPVSLDELTRSNTHIGVQWIGSTARTGGSVFVSHRGRKADISGGMNTLFELGLPMLEAASLTQEKPFVHDQQGTSTDWGHWDLAADQARSILFGADETGIYAYDASSAGNGDNTLIPLTGPITVGTNGTPTTASWPLTDSTFFTALALGTATNTIRALAFDPDGNGGGGLFYCADGASDVVAFTPEGTFVSRVAGSWNLIGLAFDSQTGMLWGTSSMDGVSIIEIDPTTGATGRQFDRVRPSTTAGGLSMVEFSAFSAASPSAISAHLAFENGLIVLEQGSVDSLAVHRLNFFSDPGGLMGPTGSNTDDPELQMEFAAAITGTRSVGPFSGAASDIFEFEVVDGSGTRMNELYTLFMNVCRGDRLRGANTIIPEFDLALEASTTPLATPSVLAMGVAGEVQAFALAGAGLIPSMGGGFIGLADDFGMMIGTSAAEMDVVYPNGMFANMATLAPFALNPGDVVRFQAIFEQADPAVMMGSAGLRSTNVVEFTVAETPLGAEVEATGAANCCAPGPFWRITNNNMTMLSITQVTISTIDSSQQGVRNLFIDVDQAFTDGSQFLFGDGAGLASTGTYRNNTEVDTGLVFGSTNTYGVGAMMGVPGSATASCGWSTTSLTSAAPASGVAFVQDVTFDFTSFEPGDVFEWDMDIDGLVAPGGQDLAGVHVTITWSDGSVTRGELAGDGMMMSTRSVVSL